MDFKEKLKRVPKSFGVYLMKDARGSVLYVGKAKNLRSRLSSYFQKSVEDPKTRALVKEIVDFEVILLSSEVEALLLERNLIREHKPDFNVILRDDKEYPYLRIDFQSKWPRIKKIRRYKHDGAKYLGPYSHPSHLNRILDLCYQIFPLIRCSEYTFKTVKRPCNYYHMKKCLGPCTLPVEESHYKDMVQSAVSFLQGKDKTVLKKLQTQMREAAESEDFEKAAHYRDQIEALKVINQNQSVVVKNIEYADVLGAFVNRDYISFHLLEVREGNINASRNYVLPMKISDVGKITNDFLLQYYARHTIPKEVYVFCDLEDQTLEQFLKEQSGFASFKMQRPKAGQKKNILDLASKNAEYHLEEHLTFQSKRSNELLILKEKLELKKIPHRIECFDISNIQGTAIVASQVCFIDGKASKENYRLFNIEDQREGPDDYWSLMQVMRRYMDSLLKRSELPDLILIDGGKGQLSSVLKVAKEYPDLDLDIRSIAKNRVYHSSDRRREQSEERIFFPGKKYGLVLKEASPEFRILTQARDEAHRFAITHHRKRRKKISEMSVLDQVPGIGPVTKKKILSQVPDIQTLSKMSVEEYQEELGLSKKISESLKAALLYVKGS